MAQAINHSQETKKGEGKRVTTCVEERNGKEAPDK